MSSKNHKEVHGNNQLVANTTGKEQRSKYQNELTKKKRMCELNNQFKRILGKFLQWGDALKACFESVIIFLSNMFELNMLS
jgi:hypothetical protein